MTAPSDVYLPTDATERAQFPMFDGLLGYFPAALAWVSRCSKVGNDQHNAGEPLHWAMDKSTDHRNKIVKHLLDAGADDTDGIPHSVKVAWRALALAQEDLMARKGAPLPHNATQAPKPPAEPARIATAAEIEAYDQWQAKDRSGATLLIGDTVRIVDPSHDDVLCGFGKGSFGKIAGRSTDTKMVMVQDLWKPNTRWFNSKQLEWVRP